MENDEEVETHLASKLGNLRDQDDSPSESESVESVEVDEAAGFEEPARSGDASDSEAIEPFNLDEEREEGKFENGAFVKTDSGDRFDAWLDSVDQTAIRKARAAQKARRKEATAGLSEEEALERLGPLLDQAETAMEAIEGCGDSSRIEGITTACTALSAIYPDVYDMEREQLNRIFSSKFGRNFKRKRVSNNWVFKWPDQDEVHGPFTATEMQAWLDHGYFTTGVVVSPANEREFCDVSQVRF